MSYDLYFYKKKDSSLTEEGVAAYLNNNLPFNNSKSSKQWDSENPETGAYFTIDWNEADAESEYFEGFTYLNFSFSINFFRPRFFGLESFPFVNRLVNDLGLFILNPQDGDEAITPTKYPPGHLQNEWIRHNDQLSLERFEEFDFKYLPLDKSNYMWWYQLHRTGLENSLTEDIFVAGIFVLESKEDKKLYTVCVWPQHIPVVLPRVDYVIVKKVYNSFFKEIEESGIVSYETIIKELGDSLEAFQHIVPDLKVLRQENANKMKKLFNRLKLICSVTEFGAMVNNDKFVNVHP